MQGSKSSIFTIEDGQKLVFDKEPTLVSNLLTNADDTASDHHTFYIILCVSV